MADALPEECLWQFQKIDGYMDLRMWARAREELGHVAEPYRDTNPFRKLTLRLALEVNDWPHATEVAWALCEDDPRQPAHWIHLAYATRRTRGIEAARTILLKAIKRFPGEAIIPFNLACYECQLGHRDQAMEYLQKAEALEPDCRNLAMRDDDLKPLWPDLEEPRA